MGLILRLSLRNLFRQKRRNFFLGIGIAFGMMILVIASSFSHGMVDVLINDVVSDAFGHLVIDCKPGSHAYYSVIRDKERIMEIIEETIREGDIIEISESLDAFGRAVGNGASDNIVLVGLSPATKEEKMEFFKGFFTLVDGDFEGYFSEEIEYPVIISEKKAKSLNVKPYDVIRFRVPTVTGQIQAANLTVVAIANTSNTFMEIVAFSDGERVKKLLGYKPWESGSLQLKLKNPKRTVSYYADLLHQKLNPGLISIAGQIDGNDANLYAFRNTDNAKEVLMSMINITGGNKEDGLGKDGVMVSQHLAEELGLEIGEEFYFEYPTKFRGLYQEKLKVDAVYTTDSEFGGNVILVNEERIHDIYNRFLPESNNTGNIRNDSWQQVLATEWKLLERSRNSRELNNKYRIERLTKTDQAKFDVITMYEGASDILSLEGAVNSVTILSVVVLFFIILIGVVNTLRMTIKERTSEIGTMRAIGMQKNDVRNLFILETVLLTAISCIVGILIGTVITQILGLIEFNTDSALNIVLKDKHLYFKPNILGIVAYFGLITAISAITALFPARDAANLTVVKALSRFK